MESKLLGALPANLKRPETDDELWDFIYSTWGISVPRKVAVEGHTAPFEFVADAFFERYQNMIAFANRNGGKTMDFALVEVLDSIFKDKCETGHVAAIRSQANKGYRYVLDFIKNPNVWPSVKNSIQSETVFANDAMIQILTGTIAGVNSPHPHKAKADEVELMKWEVLQEFFSMAKSGNGIRAQNILTSTRKYIYGSMQRILDAIESGEMPNWKIYTWNIYDISVHFTLEDLEQYRDLVKKNDDGSDVSFYDLFAPYAGKTDGFYPLDDAALKFSTMTLDTWRTQWTNEKPSREGLIYFMFEEAKNTAELYYKHWLDTYVGQDFGTSNPNAALLIQYDELEDTIYVLDEDFSYRTEITDVTEEVYVDWAKDFNVLQWICDPRGAGQIMSMNKVFGKEGLSDELAEAAPATMIEDGIEKIRHRLREGKLIIDVSCTKLIKEIGQLYHYKEGTDKPEKVDDHGCDALRYLIEYIESFMGQEIKINVSKGGLYNRGKK